MQYASRAQYRDKVNEEKRKAAYLQKEIAAIETEMVNEGAYQKIFELEAERKNLRKALDLQH